MKKLFLSMVLLTITVLLSAQPPQAFKYQAVIRNEAGNVVSNQSVEIIISIRNETPSGTVIYQETFITTTNQFGLVNLNIGYNPTLGSLALIDWFADSKFLEVEIDIDGSGVYLSMGTNELLSVPYALYAGRSADGYWDLFNSNIYYISGNVGIGTSTPNARLHVNDRIRIGEDPIYPNVYGEISHVGEGTGFAINSHAGGGSWADLHFQTNAYTRMLIESAGNVGIGTITPDADLHVEDRVRIGEDPAYSNVYGEIYHEGGANGFVINANAGGSWADLYFQTDGTTQMFIESAGNVGIGTTTLAAGYKLSVDGKVACEEVLVNYSDSWPDFVFEENYNLRELNELESIIKSDKHLPDIPSASEVKENGFQLGDMQKRLLQKVEELTLYTIEQDKQIKALQQELELLKTKNSH